MSEKIKKKRSATDSFLDKCGKNTDDFLFSTSNLGSPRKQNDRSIGNKSTKKRGNAYNDLSNAMGGSIFNFLNGTSIQMGKKISSGVRYVRSSPMDSFLGRMSDRTSSYLGGGRTNRSRIRPRGAEQTYNTSPVKSFGAGVDYTGKPTFSIVDDTGSHNVTVDEFKARVPENLWLQNVRNAVNSATPSSSGNQTPVQITPITQPTQIVSQVSQSTPQDGYRMGTELPPSPQGAFKPQQFWNRGGVYYADGKQISKETYDAGMAMQNPSQKYGLTQSDITYLNQKYRGGATGGEFWENQLLDALENEPEIKARAIKNAETNSQKYFSLLSSGSPAIKGVEDTVVSELSAGDQQKFLTDTANKLTTAQTAITKAQNENTQLSTQIQNYENTNVQNGNWTGTEDDYNKYKTAIDKYNANVKTGQENSATIQSYGGLLDKAVQVVIKPTIKADTVDKMINYGQTLKQIENTPSWDDRAKILGNVTDAANTNIEAKKTYLTSLGTAISDIEKNNVTNGVFTGNYQDFLNYKQKVTDYNYLNSIVGKDTNFINKEVNQLHNYAYDQAKREIQTSLGKNTNTINIKGTDGKQVLMSQSDYNALNSPVSTLVAYANDKAATLHNLDNQLKSVDQVVKDLESKYVKPDGTWNGTLTDYYKYKLSLDQYNLIADKTNNELGIYNLLVNKWSGSTDSLRLSAQGSTPSTASQAVKNAIWVASGSVGTPPSGWSPTQQQINMFVNYGNWNAPKSRRQKYNKRRNKVKRIRVSTRRKTSR